MRLKTVVANLAIAAFSTAFFAALALTAGELYFRMKVRGADTRPFPWMEFHERRGWALKPGEYHRFDFNESLESRVSINALGTRNPPMTLAVPPGRRRVSVIGDSFVFAAALNEPETFVGRLRGLMGDSVEVVNLGVESYGNGQQALLLEDLAARGYEVGGDLVLVFFSNDPMDNAGLEMGHVGLHPGRPVFHVDSAGALRATAPTPPAGNPWGHRAAERSIMLVFLKSRITNLVTANPWLLDLAARLGYRARLPRVPGVVEAFYGEGWRPRWDNTAGILAWLGRTARERHGARLTIAYMPSPFQVLEALQQVARRQAAADSAYAGFLADMDRPQRLLRELCEREGIRFVDPSAALREAARRETPYFLYEAHLNPAGSRVFAEVLAGALASR